MRNALALLALVTATASAHASNRDAERPEPQPCKCARIRPHVSLELAGSARDTFRTAVLARVKVHQAAIGRCLGPINDDAKLELSFKRNATKPHVSARGSAALTSCLERISWSGFAKAPHAATIVVSASIDFRRG